MKALRKALDRVKPQFEEGGRLHAFHSVYDGIETFLYTPRTVAAMNGVHVHDAIDSKRTMIIVVLALLPCFLFGCYNCGYQHWLAAGATEFPFFSLFAYGLLSILPMVLTTYIVGLGIEFAVAQYRGEEIQEGFLVTGLILPMVLPVGTPIWMVAVATAFAVIFAKEVFGGTGYNIVNIALTARAFLFFAYPAKMSGDGVFVSTATFGGWTPAVPDGYTCATPLGEVASASNPSWPLDHFTGAAGQTIDAWQSFIGLIPGSFGETSTLCIIIGAIILLFTRIADWRIIFSIIVGALAMGFLSNALATPTYPGSYVPAYDQLLYGGLLFGAVFMATDPVTACRTNTGKWIYGLLIGIVAVIIRNYNTGYPEGAMLAILLMNVLAPLIDWCVVQANVSRRMRRLVAIERKEED